ncbi:MAG TPA: EAL domain-containing protein [Gallionella sp.]|nr:EAL domain-containing protein [Gallionella sp.]
MTIRTDTPTILIVDDTPANLSLAVESLEAHGMRVSVAQDGEEGITRAEFAQPNLIMLDVLMPGLDGFEVCRRLKANPRTRDIPVVFMTSLTDIEDKVKGFDVGAVDYVTKPLHITEVIARIDTHLKVRAMQQQLQAQNEELERYRAGLELQVAERTAALRANNRLLMEEITERKHAEEALNLQEQELRSLLENTPDAIARFDKDCRCIYANHRMLEDLNLSWAQASGKLPSELPGGESAIAYEERIRRVLSEGSREDFELTLKNRQGKQVVNHVRLTPEFGIGGGIVSVLAVGRDITETHEYRQSVHRMTFYDALTDLPNRALLIDRIGHTMADSSWSRRFGLMMLDLDRFKEINDTLGHDVGDRLLREVAARLLQCVRVYDTVARLGGDEFAILLPQVRESDDLVTVARKIVESFVPPFNIADKELFISASIGIAIYPGDSVEIDALFKYADSAMYHAKKMGRNNFQFYSRELTELSAGKMMLESALRKARKNGELELYYQPQVELASGRIVSAEALLRWHHPKLGLVCPDRFIPLSEETGLIVGIGEWVLHAACQTAAAWNRARPEPFRIAVNLSMRQFMQNDLLATVRGVLQETQCNPEWLKLEITESLLLEDGSDALGTLKVFDDMGLDISIDDFGTGYSALSYLSRFPVSQLKIDRSFVRDIPENQEKSELVKAIISIAQALNLELVAEGVETMVQADYLNRHGCLLAQGYLYGKPMPQAEFEALLAEQKA